MSDYNYRHEYYRHRPRESELIASRVVSMEDWKHRFCKHKRFPCKQCGTVHYEGCQCGFCGCVKL